MMAMESYHAQQENYTTFTADFYNLSFNFVSKFQPLAVG